MGAEEGQKGPARGNPLNLKAQIGWPPTRPPHVAWRGAAQTTIAWLYEAVCHRINVFGRRISSAPG